MNTLLLERMQQFRDQVYHTFTKRAAASSDLIDALAQAEYVTSPVAVSESPAFRRKYTSIYETLSEGRCAWTALRTVLYQAVPSASATIAGYEVYALDVTPEPRPAAPTLKDRTPLKSNPQVPAVPGHKYSWLVRLLHLEHAWVAPMDVQRIASHTTSNQVAVTQVHALDTHSPHPKVVVADSSYANAVFLAVLLLVTTVVALVRLRNNQVLYRQPGPYQGRGAPRKHGTPIHLARPPAQADRNATMTLRGQTVRLRAWCQVHLRGLAAVSGLLLCVEFLNADGTRRYQHPLWLFWTGPASIALEELCRMYLGRFMIEHLFRFLKQHLGLNAAVVTTLSSAEYWMWLCALAYWQLLLAADLVVPQGAPWRRCPARADPFAWSARQVQRALPSIMGVVGTPAPAPRPSGKGSGRTQGYHPPARPTYPVVYKAKKPVRKRKKAVNAAELCG